jgi:hypothetical protein
VGFEQSARERPLETRVSDSFADGLDNAGRGGYVGEQ